LRRARKSLLFLHHSGRNLNARGTSKREDLLDTIIALRHPADYEPSKGLRVEVHFEKTRHFYGDDAEPFEVALTGGSDIVPQWVLKPLDQRARANELFQAGGGVRDVMEELKVSRATAFRLQHAFRQQQSQVSNAKVCETMRLKEAQHHEH